MRRAGRARAPTAAAGPCFFNGNWLWLASLQSCKQSLPYWTMLSWDDFRYATPIADTRSLAGAAEALGVNHTTVFRRLGQIEQQLGSRLFERGRAGYAPTPRGEQMVGRAARAGA